mmetsp:Transcript_34/g.73  ORF Transcript_34/g.73 Transcript_34/m.73 type:complete len:226 (+) Transcript_34:964-1641(+)|eukprot:498925-Pleurochrysis_carterae.AAC.7
MRIWEKVHSLVLEIGHLQPALIEACAGGGEVEDSHHARAEGALELTVLSEDVVCDHAPLSVGRPRKRNHPLPADNRVLHLDCISDGPYVWDGSPQLRVDDDTTARVEFDAGTLRQRRVRAHTQAEQHHVGGDVGHAVAEDDVAAERGRVVLERLDRLSSHHADPVALHLLLNHHRHFRVERGEKLRQRLDQRHFQTAPVELFSHFNADEAAAGHDRGLCILAAQP